jgi:hypothetical protein
MPASILNFQQFVSFLQENSVPHSVVDAETVEVPSKGAPLPGNLYVKWHSQIPFLQLVHFMYVDVPESRLAELETAIARLNHVLETGGFGIDHKLRRLYCRFTVPCFPPEGITPTTFNQLAHGLVRNAKEFYETFGLVISGRAGSEITDIYTEIVKARQTAPGGGGGAQA